ncbi:MAG: translation initiation factor IF-2 [Candidatus Gracilibacteria bacterium]|nr:translation initiation factor IF-2 [Candidatus Gracilibacteria bacterium]
MSTKIADLAEKLGIETKELREKLKELGFEVSPKARVLEDEVADLVYEELSEKGGASDGEGGESNNEDDSDVAEIYDEIIAQQQERQIIKSQRKKTAGKIKEEPPKSPTSTPVLTASDSIEMGDFISVKEFSEKTGINAAKIIGELMKNGILANVNQQIDFDTTQIIATDLGITVHRLRTAAGADELMSGDISNMIKEDDSSLLVERPPVVCIMGHVDHGKTKLLDAIRNTNVVDGEAGGITQHIAAYQVSKKNKLITFLDTPGHEAFTEMRARGAKVTDIAILVVAADEGVKPQTVEALNHAKEAGVPIIVAVNKMDKPNANLDKVRAELSEHGLQAEEWGGKTVFVPVSAIKGEGIDALLDMILLTAEMEDLKANPNREAVGTVIEAHLDHSLGPVATIIVNTGTLKIMDYVVVGKAHGRIKLMKDHTGKSMQTAVPSTPLLIAGLSITPKSGDILQVVRDDKMAKGRAEEIRMIMKKEEEERMSGLNQLISTVKSEKILRIVLKADTKGSLEAIKGSISKIKDEDVAIKIIHGGVGTVTKSDVMMASASRGIVIAFQVEYDSPVVPKIATHENVEIKMYKIIYNLLEDIKKILSGLLEPEITEVVLGRAQVRQVFFSKKNDMIIGCRVLSGKLQNKAKLKIIRNSSKDTEDQIVGKGIVDSLRKVDELVKEIGEGNECGIKYKGDIVLQEGDILEAYIEEEKHRTIT